MILLRYLTVYVIISLTNDQQCQIFLFTSLSNISLNHRSPCQIFLLTNNLFWSVNNLFWPVNNLFSPVNNLFWPMDHWWVNVTVVLQTNHFHLLLQGEDRLYLNPEDGSPQVFNSASSLPQQPSPVSPSAFVGNKQWHVMHIPHTYLMHNWPIRVRIMVHCFVVFYCNFVDFKSFSLVALVSRISAFKCFIR